MSGWQKLPVLAGGPNPCGNCPDIVSRLEMDRRVGVGFGEAHLSRDGKIVWEEDPAAEFSDALPVSEAEKIAARDPDHDWRIVLNGPLHGETYQRQGPRYWVLVERNAGFA